MAASSAPASAAWLDELEAEIGWTRAKALFDLAEEAKAHLLEFAAVNGIDIDFMPGQLSVAHKQRYVDDYRKYADYMRDAPTIRTSPSWTPTRPPSGSARRTISAARATPAPAISIR